MGGRSETSPRRRRGFRSGPGAAWGRVGGPSLACAGLAVLACATPQAQTVASPEAPEAQAVLSEEGKRYLTNVYLLACAPEYFSYPEGEGPPVPARTDAEWAQRREELDACLGGVVEQYTTLEAVRALSWTPGGHSLSPGEMKGIVRDGRAFLDDYAAGLVEREKRRQGASGGLPEEPAADSRGDPAPPS